MPSRTPPPPIRLELRFHPLGGRSDEAPRPAVVPLDGDDLAVLLEGLVALANTPGHDTAGEALGLIHRIASALAPGILTVVEEDGTEPSHDPELHPGEDAALAAAIDSEAKVALIYSDVEAELTHRTVWPVALANTRHGLMLHAWCELRGAFRQFRVDRILNLRATEERYSGGRIALTERWLEAEARRAVR